MAEQISTNGAIRLKCVCEQELFLDRELLGRTFRCPHCQRYLRVGMQFVLADKSLAPNITVLCTCGRFIVEATTMAGKVATCRVCGQRIMLPRPVQKKDSPLVLRVPPRVLRRQLKRVQGRSKQISGEMRQVHVAGHRGRISLRPGQKVCANPECSLPLAIGANVCCRCGTNVTTGVAYKALGPEKDPRGKWKQL